MNTTLRKLAPAVAAGLTLGALALTGCETIKPQVTPKHTSGAADYSVYVAMGTSVTAGTESGGLVDRHQRQSYPALFAKAAGSLAFDMPFVDQDGLPPLSRLVQVGPPLIITNAGRTPGNPTNFALPTAYHDLGVPGSILPDVADTSLYASTPGRAAAFALIQRHRGPLLLQLFGQFNPPPTFVSFEYGANELLGPASNGSGTPLLPAPLWANYLANTLGEIRLNLPNVKMALFTIPDVTSIPLVTTIPPLVLGPDGQPVKPFVPILGMDGGVARPLIYGQDYILLTAGALLAGGTGYPVGTTSYVSGNPVPGNGNPLPDNVVLSATEVVSLRAAQAAYNNAIRAQAATYHWAVVDLAGLLHTASTTGVHVQGTTYTTAFLSGGLESLDGVHPTDLAHGLICNAMIEAVNSTYGSTIPLVDLTKSMTASADRAVEWRSNAVPVPAMADAAQHFADLQITGQVAIPWRTPQP